MHGTILANSVGICHGRPEVSSVLCLWHPSVALATGAAFLAPVQVTACSERRSSTPVKFPPVMVRVRLWVFKDGPCGYMFTHHCLGSLGVKRLPAMSSLSVASCQEGACPRFWWSRIRRLWPTCTVSTWLNEPYEVSIASTWSEAQAMLGELTPDLMLLDVQLPDGDGLQLLRDLKARGAETQTVVMTAHGSINVAVDAMRDGAYDFLVKPFNQDRLLRTLHNALEAKSLRYQVEEFKKTERPKYHNIVGSSLPLQAVYRTIDAAAPTNATVFIMGETGTGKELVAQSVHAQSTRRDRNFVVLNCAAIPKDLIESEIFGHVKGAFTGASESRDGAAKLADKGTLFLDEIGEMDLALQGKLLRFLQSGTFNRVGASKTEEVDVRIVCATNRDPWQEVKRGNFREDLYYRLNVIPVTLPPLRERGDDIIEIAELFLDQFAREMGRDFEALSDEARDVFLNYAWPGNVRQLQNVVRNIVVLHNAKVVEAHMIPPLEEASPSADVSMSRADTVALPATSASASKPAPEQDEYLIALPDLVPMWQIEQMMVDAALARFDGNVNKAAALLEISPSSIYRKRKTTK